MEVQRKEFDEERKRLAKMTDAKLVNTLRICNAAYESVKQENRFPLDSTNTNWESWRWLEARLSLAKQELAKRNYEKKYGKVELPKWTHPHQD